MSAMRSEVWGRFACSDDALEGTRLWRERVEFNVTLDFGCVLEAERISRNSYSAQ